MVMGRCAIGSRAIMLTLRGGGATPGDAGNAKHLRQPWIVDILANLTRSTKWIVGKVLIRLITIVATKICGLGISIKKPLVPHLHAHSASTPPSPICHHSNPTPNRQSQTP